MKQNMKKNLYFFDLNPELGRDKIYEAYLRKFCSVPDLNNLILFYLCPGSVHLPNELHHTFPEVSAFLSS